MRKLTDREETLLLTEQWQRLVMHRGELLDELFARAQRLESTLVLTEDQRDKASKERDDVLADLARVVAQGDDARSRLGRAIETLRLSNDGWAQAIAERDKAQSQRDSFLADLERVVAERDAAVARAGVLRTELHCERQQHASTREMLRAKERGNT